MEELRRSGRRAREEMRDDGGRDGERGGRRHPDTDASAEGMKSKQAREMEELRRSGRRAREEMRDGGGRPRARNEARGTDGTPEVDLSAAGMMKKKDAELDALRAKGRQRRGVGNGTYDSGGRPNARTAPKDGRGDAGRNENNADLPARGTGSEKDRATGAGDGRGERRGRRTDAPATPGGTAGGTAPRTGATGAGAARRGATVAPREPTADEASRLRTALGSGLRVPDDARGGDAADPLDYALDTIGGGTAVGAVVRELAFMEMGVFDADTADGFGRCLSSFLLDLDGDASGNIADEKNGESKGTEEPRTDLSTSSAARRPAKGMHSTPPPGPAGAKESGDRGVPGPEGAANRRAGGGGTGSASGRGDGDGARAGPEGSAIDRRHKRELRALMRDRSLGREERARRIRRTKEKYSALSRGVSAKGAAGGSGPGVAARALAPEENAETGASSPSEVDGGAGSVEPRAERGGEGSNGVLVEQCANAEKEENADVDARIDENRKQRHEQSEDEEDLRENVAKGDQPSSGDRKEGEANSKSGRPALEARHDSATASNEGGGNGAFTGKAVARAPDNGTLDERRKREFQAIMRDRGLSKEDRLLRVEQMRRKYSAANRSGAPVVAPPGKGAGKGSGLDSPAPAVAGEPIAEADAASPSSETGAEGRSERDAHDPNGSLDNKSADANGGGRGRNDIDPPRLLFVHARSQLGPRSQPPVRPGGRRPSEKCTFKAFMSKSVEEQQREEIKLIVRDPSLRADERADRIEKIKAIYAASDVGEGGNMH